MPPMGGWSITVNIKGQEFTYSGSPKRVVQQISQIQIKNDIYAGDDAIWEYCNKIWCERDPKRCINGDSPTTTVGSQSKLLTFAYALKALVRNGLQPVSQQKADERAIICARCPRNKNMESCSSCRQAVNLLTKGLIGKRQTRYDRKLKHCGSCGCDLKAKIHFPLNVDDKNEYPADCWVTKESKKEG